MKTINVCRLPRKMDELRVDRRKPRKRPRMGWNDDVVKDMEERGTVRDVMIEGGKIEISGRG